MNNIISVVWIVALTSLQSVQLHTEAFSFTSIGHASFEVGGEFTLLRQILSLVWC